MDFPVLAALDDATRRQVLAGPRRRYSRGEAVFHEGDPATALHLLVSGHVAVTVDTSSGDSAVLVVLGPGSAFGELALLGDGGVRSATIRCLERVETVVLARERFEQLRTSSPALDRLIVEVLSQYVRRLQDRLLEAWYVPVEQRVLRQVLALARVYGDGGDGTVVPVTQDVLAAAAGSTRATTNQVLRRAEEAGLVSLSRGRVRVLDAARLARRAALR